MARRSGCLGRVLFHARMEDYELYTYPLYHADAAYDSDKQSLRHNIALGFTRDWIHDGDCGCAAEAGKNTHIVRT